MEKKASTRLRELLNRRELLVMSGGFSPLHARMSEMLGYEAFFMSGSQVAAFVYGYPDVGLLGLHEMVESVRRITNVTDIPVFADADTGYGNAVNVYYTVQAYIRAGAAGLHIENQEHRKSPVRWRGGGSSPSRKRSASTKPRLRRRKSWTQTSLSVHAVTRSAPRAAASKMRLSAVSRT